MKNKKTRNMILISLFAAIICISSYITVTLPISAVPFTAQTLAIMLIALLLPVELSSAAVGLFLLLGAVGLPVFSGGASGIKTLVGPTGGYLFGFLAGTYLIGVMKSRFKTLPGYFIAAIIGGIVVVYALGVPYLAYSLKMTLGKAFTVGALPYLLFDLVKAAVATGVAYKLRPTLEKLV